MPHCQAPCVLSISLSPCLLGGGCLLSVPWRFVGILNVKFKKTKQKYKVGRRCSCCWVPSVACLTSRSSRPGCSPLALLLSCQLWTGPSSKKQLDGEDSHWWASTGISGTAFLSLRGAVPQWHRNPRWYHKTLPWSKTKSQNSSLGDLVSTLFIHLGLESGPWGGVLFFPPLS